MGVVRFIFPAVLAVASCLLLVLVLLQVASGSPSKNPVGNEAEQLMNSGRFVEALAIFNRNLAATPADVFSMQGAAICHSNMGRVDLAGKMFEQAASMARSDQMHYNAGVSYHQIGDYTSAMRNYNHCITINKSMRPCHVKLASIYRDLDDPMNTQRYLLNAISLEPGNPDAYSYLADTYNNLKQFQLAIDNYEKVLKIVGANDIKTLISIGDTYTNMKSPEKAYKAFSRSLKILERAPPEHRQDMLYVTVGLFFAGIEMGYWKNYEKTSALIIELASLYNQKYEKNRIHVEKRARNNLPPSGPDDEPMAPNPLSPYRLMFLDAPHNLYRDISNQWAQQTYDSAEKLSSGTLESPSSPLSTSEIDENGEGRNGDISDDASESGDNSRTTNSGLTKRILNIGYMSRRFYNYPGTQMMIRLFPLHDRSRVKVHAFANGPDDTSNYRAFIRNNSDIFMDLINDSFIESVANVNAANLDVLIDYDGIHDFNSIKLLSQVKSAIKITWLGYAGTIAGGGAIKSTSSSQVTTTEKGKYSIEYIISDKNVLPPDMAHTLVYKEKMIYLPYSYQPQDEHRGENITNLYANKRATLALDSCSAGTDSSSIIDDASGAAIQIDLDIAKMTYSEYLANRMSDRKWLLSHFKVYESLNKTNAKSDDKDLFAEKIASSIWLICFNRLSKITPDALQDWLTALNLYPNAVLVLMKDSPEAQKHVTKTAKYMGISSGRILFFSRVNSLYLYRAILRSADYFLDTRHYNSHTVATDSLIEHTPVVALQGATFSSRVSSSLNSATGLEYVHSMNLDSRMGLTNYLAYILGRNQGMAHKMSFIVKRSIESMLSDSKSRRLYNSPQFTRFIEYAAMAAKDLKVIASVVPESSSSYHIVTLTGSSPI